MKQFSYTKNKHFELSSLGLNHAGRSLMFGVSHTYSSLKVKGICSYTAQMKIRVPSKFFIFDPEHSLLEYQFPNSRGETRGYGCIIPPIS